MYGISAARPSSLAAWNAAAIRSAPVELPRWEPGDDSTEPPRCCSGESPPAPTAVRSSTSAMSLSPRPERHSTSYPSPPPFSSSQAIACEDSSAGMIPSSRQSSAKAASACASVTAK